MIHLCGEEKYVRLPTFVKPNHYDLSLTIPNLVKLEFVGEAVIFLDVLKRTDRIELHLSDLEFENENIKLVNLYSGLTFEPEQAEISKKDGLLKLTFRKPIAAGNYKLEISFEGLLAEESDGLYLIRYNYPDVQRNTVAVFSHFKYSSARKCFPCWDEPSFRASFKINITVPRKFTVLSNMPTERVERLGIFKRYYFEKTPPMCSYLVAITIGEFGVLETKSRYGVPLRIFTARGREEHGRFALDVAAKALKFFTDYFKTPYPLPKLDLVAVPDFMTDTMEQWGLITFREINLLTDPSVCTDTTKKWIVTMVSHQVAHQWFGSLVGLDWWDQTWLQEACAELAGCLCVDYFFPDFRVWQDYYWKFLQTAFFLDEGSNVHPVERALDNPAHLDDFHDILGFNKGASLMRMLHHYVGDEDFREGLRCYLTKYMYKNASPDEFWEAIETASKKPVKNIMSTWTKQAGFPVVSVNVTPGCECLHYKEGITVNLVQKKFVMRDAKGTAEAEKAFWIIPISLISSGQPKKEMLFLMDSREMKIYLPDTSIDGWIKVNPGCIGYYRVHYIPKLLKRLAIPIAERKLGTMNRMGILDDLFHMVKYTYTSAAHILKFLEVYENEKEFVVWSKICRILKKLVFLTSHTQFEQEFERVRSNILQKLSELFTEKSEEEGFEKRLRQMVLGQMSWLDDEKMINQVRKDVADKLAGDTRIFCYRTDAESGGLKEFDTLMKLFKTVDTHEQKRSILDALSDGTDENLLRKLLTFAISDEAASEETILIVMSITSSKAGKDLLWDFYRTNWRDILNKVKNEDCLSKTLEDIKEKYATEPLAMEIETFFSRRLPCNEVNFRTVLETLKDDGSWLSRESEELKKYFQHEDD